MEAGECTAIAARQQLAAALDLLDSASEQTLSAFEATALALHSTEELLQLARRLERHRNLLSVADQYVITAMQAAGCCTQSSLGLFASMDGFLSSLLQISRAEARQRVRAAAQLTPVVDISGYRRGPRMPVLAAMQRTGEISAERADQVVTALSEWQKLNGLRENITDESLSRAETVLAQNARMFAPRDLQRFIDHYGELLDPDGVLDDFRAQQAVRSMKLTTVRRGIHKGMTRLEAILTPEVGAETRAVLDPLAKPIPVRDEAGAVVQPDDRDHGMRMHDAFAEVIGRQLRAEDVPAHGGTPAALIITTSAEAVATGAGSGICEDGTILPVATVLDVADECEVVRAGFGPAGDLLNLGYEKRIATKHQTYALIARDRGCTFPGCEKTPKWCQRHHIVEWFRGGRTDVDNLTLVCGYHHSHFQQHGWSAELVNGVVRWRPPPIVDPDQRPMINTRHRAPTLVPG
jgi:hypothetical protein